MLNIEHGNWEPQKKDDSIHTSAASRSKVELLDASWIDGLDHVHFEAAWLSQKSLLYVIMLYIVLYIYTHHNIPY